MGLVDNYGVVVRLNGLAGEKKLDLADCVDADARVGKDFESIGGVGEVGGLVDKKGMHAVPL